MRSSPKFATVPGFAERLRDMITDIDERGVIPTLRQALRRRRAGAGVVMNQPLEFVRPFDPAPITTLLWTPMTTSSLRRHRHSTPRPR